ncbi:MAG: serine hydroxymethyltransferase [Rickettsia sp.]|nr:serine hydroxymethyltransferase [Rickettsia sp.]
MNIRIEKLIELEKERQLNTANLIASENIASQNTLKIQSSVLNYKYVEGYSGKRYYQGCAIIDKIEELCIYKAQKLFNAKYINVQSHSGSQANQAVYIALTNHKDKILGMSLQSGGHLTHGSKVNFSGKFLDAICYEVDKQTHKINYEQIEELAKKHNPKIIIAGFSAYSRKIDFAKFRKIADKVGAYLLADISHISGLVAAGLHENPVNFADVVTSTTHKTLRGPKGAIIFSNHEKIMQKIDKAVFPAVQGGAFMHVIAAKAAAFEEALTKEFKIYIENVIENSKALSNSLINRGYDILTGGSDNHMSIINLTNRNITGKAASLELEKANIITNMNQIPFDDKPANVSSGIRIGTAFCTSRNLPKQMFEKIGNLIADALLNLEQKSRYKYQDSISYDIKNEIISIMNKYPI